MQSAAVAIREPELSPFDLRWELEPESNVVHLDEWLRHEHEHKFRAPTAVGPVAERRSAGFQIELSEREFEEVFRGLSDAWIRETRQVSDLVEILLNPVHLQIIGLGPRVIPLILREVEANTADWVIALESLTRQKLGSPASDFDEIRELWLAWGKETGYLAQYAVAEA